MSIEKQIESHRLPCGAMTVNIKGVCRRRLRDHYDSLLDRLTKEVHPEGKDPDQEFDEDDMDQEETRDEKKKRLVEEGKLRAEVKKELDKYKEKLMGNSKLLQDPSGKMPKKD